MVAHRRCGGSLRRCGCSSTRCGGSLLALQTPEAVVPGSNRHLPQWAEDRQSHCVYCTAKSLGREKPPSESKKTRKKEKKINRLLILKSHLINQTNYILK